MVVDACVGVGVGVGAGVGVAVAVDEVVVASLRTVHLVSLE